MWESCGWVCSAPSWWWLFVWVVLIVLMVDQDNVSCHEAPSWWWLSTRGRPGPSQRSLSRWSSSCPCMSLVTLWTKMLGVLEKWCNLIRAKRVVVKVTLPFLLIGMFILRRFYSASSNWLKTESFNWKLVSFFCKPICLRSFITWSAFCTPSCRDTSCQNQEEGRCFSGSPKPPCSEFPPWEHENNVKHTWADDQRISHWTTILLAWFCSS